MIDPVTAFATASAAFKGVQALVAQGREVQDVFGQLAKWAEAVSDVQEWMGQKRKPSIFKKLTFQDDTKAAIEAVMYRQKIAAMEKEIREMFQWYGPPDAYTEFIKERRLIKARREKMVYEQMRRRKAFVEYSLAFGIIVATLGGIAWIFAVILTV